MLAAPFLLAAQGHDYFQGQGGRGEAYRDYQGADAKKAPKGAFFCIGGSCRIDSALSLALRAT
ncbi:hypothetical protein, partial [Serratia liquefaciens]|uniref:hypothetical protein n=1 Tax=Serratia liquefaciens TaxID=614 RepID=UPI003D03D68D